MKTGTFITFELSIAYNTRHTQTATARQPVSGIARVIRLPSITRSMQENAAVDPYHLLRDASKRQYPTDEE